MADRRVAWRAAQVVLAAGVIALAVRALARNWHAVGQVPIQWRITPSWLALAAGIVWATYALLVEAWRRVVLAQRQRLGYVEAARICMVSNLGKYVPGKVWTIAGAAMLAQRAGVEPAAAVASAVVLQALAVSSGVALAAFLAPGALRSTAPALVAPVYVVGALAVAGAVALTSRRVLARLQRVLPSRIPPLSPIPAAALLGAFAVNVVAWGAYGAAFWALARGLTAAPPFGWAEATVVFTISYLVGLVAAFAPGGLGPRESVFVILLTGPAGPALAAALAAASRVLLTITELGAAVPFLLFRSESQRDRQA